MNHIIRTLLLVTLVMAGFAAPVSAQSSERSYLIMARGNNLPSNPAASVSAAGGTLTRTISEVGLAVATSSDPNFAARAARISGIRSVMANALVQWVNPVAQEAVEVEFGNPPNSGDNDTLFNLQWGHDAVNSPEAWNAGYRGAGARVAVLDTGFDLDYPDLAPTSIWV